MTKKKLTLHEQTDDTMNEVPIPPSFIENYAKILSDSRSLVDAVYARRYKLRAKRSVDEQKVGEINLRFDR